MRSWILVALIACGGGTPSSPPQAPVVAKAPADAAPEKQDDLAPIPYTAEQLRKANPAGTMMQFKVTEAGKSALLQTIAFASADEAGAELEMSTATELGAPVGQPTRSRTTWEELRQHAAFPRSATTISEGEAETPAGKFASKVYVVKRGDVVATMYFANDRPGPPVLMFTERNGERLMTSVLMPAPVACASDGDCWLDDQDRPIARPASERGKVVKPCEDRSRVPACKQSVCTAIAYKC